MSDFTTFEWIIMFWFIVIGVLAQSIVRNLMAILDELKTVTRILDERFRQDFEDKYR